MKIKEYDLPEWAFLDAHSHLGNQLEGRTVILHIRSLTIIEVFDEQQMEDINLNTKVLCYTFKHTNSINPDIVETFNFIVHHSATLNVMQDSEFIIDNVLKPCARFYSAYVHWEDSNIMEGDKAKFN